MGSYDMTPEEKQEYDAYMEELSNRMFLDVYMREIGGNCYMLSRSIPVTRQETPPCS